MMGNSSLVGDVDLIVAAAATAAAAVANHTPIINADHRPGPAEKSTVTGVRLPVLVCAVVVLRAVPRVRSAVALMESSVEVSSRPLLLLPLLLLLLLLGMRRVELRLQREHPR
jgi:hypothetical protein